jgi:large subunit ribosomal protein L10
VPQVPITRAEKEVLLKEYVEELNSSQAVFYATCAGLTVAQMRKVRTALRQDHADLEVLRNALFVLAGKQTGRETVAKAVQGPTLAIFCKGDPTSPAKTLAALGRDVEALKVYGGALGDRVLSAEDVSSLATLPGRDVLVAQVLAGLQAPISGLVGVLNGIISSLAYVLQARVDQLQGSASSEAA